MIKQAFIFLVVIVMFMFVPPMAAAEQNLVPASPDGNFSLIPLNTDSNGTASAQNIDSRVRSYPYGSGEPEVSPPITSSPGSYNNGNPAEYYGGVNPDQKRSVPPGLAHDPYFADDPYLSQYQLEAIWGNKVEDGTFSYPLDVAVDFNGNVYVIDGYDANCRIQKFDSSGKFLLKWGSYGIGDGQFIEPDTIAVDSSGNVYVSDRCNHRIQKFNSDGQFIIKWGIQGSGDGEFDCPCGVAVDPVGNVYVCDFHNHRIQKFNSDGQFILKCVLRAGGDAWPECPFDITTDNFGDIYILRQYSGEVKKFSPDGSFIKSWMTSEYGYYGKFVPLSIDIDSSGNTYIYGGGEYSGIRKYSPDGIILGEWGSKGLSDQQYNRVAGLTIDESDHLYIADHLNHRIQRFSLDGNFIGNFGSYSYLGNGVVRSPRGIAIDNSGVVYIADSGNNRIQKFSSQGTFLRKFEFEKIPNNHLCPVAPKGVAIDSFGNIYVTDNGHYSHNNIVSRVLKFSPDGTFLKEWGSWGREEEEFEHPTGIAVDSSGNVYVADCQNGRIQKFSSDGIFLGKWSVGGRAEGVTVDSCNNVYVSIDDGIYCIKKFTSEGEIIIEWGSYGTEDGQFVGPGGVAVDQYGSVYVADNGNYRIQKFTSDGTFVDKFELNDFERNRYSGFPEFIGIAVDKSGRVYVSDYLKNRIIVWAPDNIQYSINADFSAEPLSGIAPLKVQFTDQSTGNPESWHWNFGDGKSSTDRNPEHTYTTEGYYDVSLTVSNADGKDSEVKSKYIAVFNDDPRNEYDITAYYCVYNSEIDGTQTVTKTISGKSYTLKASFLYGGHGLPMQGTGRTGPDGDYIHYSSSSSLHFVQISNPTQFTDDIKNRYTKLGITNFTGFGNLALNRPDLASFSVVSKYTGASGHVLEPWHSVAVDPDKIPLGTTGVLFFKDSKTTPDDSSKMEFSADDTGGGVKGRHIDIYVGEGKAAMQEWWDTGGNGYAKVSIVPVQVKTADFIADVTSGTAPLTVHFTDRSSGEPSSYMWKFGDGGTSTDPNPSHTYTQLGTYDVSLTVKGSYGSDTKKKSGYVEVFTPPEGTVKVSKSGNVDDATKDWKYPTHYDAPVFRRGIDNPMFVADLKGNVPQGHHILFEIIGPGELGCLGSVKTNTETQTWKWTDHSGKEMSAGEIPIGIYHVSGYVVNNDDNSIKYLIGSDTFYVIFNFDNTDDGAFVTREKANSFSTYSCHRWTHYLHQSSSPLIWQTALDWINGSTEVHDAVCNKRVGINSLTYWINGKSDHHHLSHDERDDDYGWNHDYGSYFFGIDSPCKIFMRDKSKNVLDNYFYVQFIHKIGEEYWAGTGTDNLIDGSNYHDALMFLLSDFRPHSAPIGKEVLEPELASAKQHPVGVCEDFAVLSVAYLRSVGIPAKLVCSVDHAWTNYFDPDKNQWMHLDSTWFNDNSKRGVYYTTITEDPDEILFQKGHYDIFYSAGYAGGHIYLKDITREYMPELIIKIISYDSENSRLVLKVTYPSNHPDNLLSKAKLKIKKDSIIDNQVGISDVFIISPGDEITVQCPVGDLHENDVIYARAYPVRGDDTRIRVIVGQSDEVSISSLITSASFAETASNTGGDNINKTTSIVNELHSENKSFSSCSGTYDFKASSAIKSNVLINTLTCYFTSIGYLYPNKESIVKVVINNSGGQLVSTNISIILKNNDIVPGLEENGMLIGSEEFIDVQPFSVVEIPITVLIPSSTSSGGCQICALLYCEDPSLCDCSENVTINPNYNIDLITPDNITIGLPFKFSVKISNSDTNTIEDLVLSLNLHNKFNTTEQNSKKILCVQAGDSILIDWNITPIEVGESNITVQAFSSGGSSSKSVSIKPLSPPELFIEHSKVSPVWEGEQFVLEANISNIGDFPTSPVILNITTPENATASSRNLNLGSIASKETKNCAITIDNNETEDYTIALNASSNESNTEKIVMIDVNTPGIFIDILQAGETTYADSHTGVIEIYKDETEALAIYLKNYGVIPLKNINIATNVGFTKQLAQISEGGEIEIPISYHIRSAGQGMLNVTVSSDEINKNFSRPYLVKSFGVDVSLSESTSFINTVVPVVISVSNDVFDTKFNNLTVTSTISNSTHVIVHNETTISLSPLEVYNAGFCWDTSGLLSGNYSITTRLSERGDEVATNEARITLIDNSPPIAGINVNRTSGTLPFAVQFTDISAGNPTKWSWNFGDGAKSTRQHPDHTYALPGNYTVNLTVSNDYGRSNISKPNFITVTAPPVENRLSFKPARSEVNTGETTEFDIRIDTLPNGLSWFNITLALTNPSAGEIVGLSYPAWVSMPVNGSLPDDSVHIQAEVPAGSVGAGTTNVALCTLTVRGDSTGETNLTLVSTKIDDVVGGRYAPETTDAILCVENIEVLNADFTANTTSGTAPLTVQFTDRSTGNPTSWHWDFDDTTTLPDQNPVHTFTEPKNYTVTLTAENEAGTSTKVGYINVTSSMRQTAIFTLNQNLATGTINDTITAGSHTGQYDYFMSILNDGENSQNKVLQKPAFTIETPDITDYGWPDYASLSASGDRIAWNFPESFNIPFNSSLSTYAATSKTEEMNFSLSLNRSLNRTVFTERGVQHLEFTVTFSDLDFVNSWGRIEYPDLCNVTASKVPYSINTDAPVSWESGNDRDRFVFNQSRLSAGVPYHFSVDVEVNTERPVNYKPKITVWTVSENAQMDLPSGKTVFVPAEMLPDYVLNATAGSDTETSWIVSRTNHHVGTLSGLIENTSAVRANFTANITSGTAPLTVRFSDASTGSPNGWNWSFGDGNISTKQHPTHTYTKPGTYTVNLTSFNDYGRSNISKPNFITVTAPPVENTLLFNPARSSIRTGETTEFDIVLDTLPNGLSGFNITLALTNPSVGEIVGISNPAWVSIPINGSLPADSVYVQGVDLDSSVEPGAMNVTLCTVLVRGDAEGTTNLTTTAMKIDNDVGDRYAPVSVDATLIVHNILPFANPDSGTFPTPADLNGDGLYEDLDGNGFIGFNDVVVYYWNMNFIELNQPLAAFDYDRSGFVGFNDVVSLYRMV